MSGPADPGPGPWPLMDSAPHLLCRPVSSLHPTGHIRLQTPASGGPSVTTRQMKDRIATAFCSRQVRTLPGGLTWISASNQQSAGHQVGQPMKLVFLGDLLTEFGKSK